MKRGVSSVLIGLALGAPALAAGAPAALADPADVKMTIGALDPGLIGTVQGESRRCVENRRVKVFKQRTGKQRPQRDEVIGTATARREHHGIYVWSLNRGRSGSFYAKARSRPGCRSSFSETYEILPRGEPPDCPAEGEPLIFCRLKIELLAESFCPYDDSEGHCSGYVSPGSAPEWPVKVVAWWKHHDSEDEERDREIFDLFGIEGPLTDRIKGLGGTLESPLAYGATTQLFDVVAYLPGDDKHCWHSLDARPPPSGGTYGPLRVVLGFNTLHIDGYLYKVPKSGEPCGGR